MIYSNGTVSATSTASFITVAAQSSGILLVNTGAKTVYVGGSTVTADQTATGGIPIAASSSVLIPTAGNGTRPLYMVTASGDTTTVSYIQPNVAQ